MSYCQIYCIASQSEELRGAFCILLSRILSFRFLFDSIHKDSPFQDLADQGVSLDPSEPHFRGKSHLKDQGQKSLPGKASSSLLCPVSDRRKVSSFSSKPARVYDFDQSVLIRSSEMVFRLLGKVKIDSEM